MKVFRKVLTATYPTYLILLSIVALIAALCDLTVYTWRSCKKIVEDLMSVHEAFSYSHYKKEREDVWPSKDS